MRMLRLAVIVSCFCLPSFAQNFVDNWLQRVSATQAAQPRWITPVVTVTPRLEQELRYDFVEQLTPGNNVTNIGNGKGLEIIPTRNTELIFNIPPYETYENPKTIDGWGDTSFLLKYRMAAGNAEHHNYILTAFLGGSIPTGTYKNGSAAAVVTPTIAGGKGWGSFSVQATLGAGLPVTNVSTVGRTILSNTTAQYHFARFFWPEVEINSTFWEGGTHDGKKQTFITPGLVCGRFPIHNRIGLTVGAGYQIAATQYHTYNHAFVGTLRMPF